MVFGVWCLVFGVWVVGFAVCGLEFLVFGLRFGIWGLVLGFEFWGWGLEVTSHGASCFSIVISPNQPFACGVWGLEFRVWVPGVRVGGGVESTRRLPVPQIDLSIRHCCLFYCGTHWRVSQSLTGCTKNGNPERLVILTVLDFSQKICRQDGRHHVCGNTCLITDHQTKSRSPFIRRCTGILGSKCHGRHPFKVRNSSAWLMRDHVQYRGNLLIRNCLPLGPSSRPMPRAL